MLDALASGHLRGAGLDVFEHEPAVSPKLVKLARAGKVTLLPHMSSATIEGRIDMGERNPNDPSDDEHSHGVLARLGGTGALVWRAARQMLGLRHEIDSRPRGGRLARAARNLPVVGVAGGFIAERSGMRQVADAARAAYPTSP